MIEKLFLATENAWAKNKNVIMTAVYIYLNQYFFKIK